MIIQSEPKSHTNNQRTPFALIFPKISHSKTSNKNNLDLPYKSKNPVFFLQIQSINHNNKNKTASMQNSDIKQQEIIAEQLAKPQPPLQDHEISNKEVIQKMIKKYQNKVTEMLKIIHKQKKQNDSLKDDLKSLNESLNNVISKVGYKNHKPHQQTSRDDVIRKQLDNEVKKRIALQKEVVQLRSRVKIIDGTKITDIYNQLTEKDKKIQQMNITIRTYAKAAIQQKNMDIYRREQEMSHKVNLLNEELLHIKKKLNEQKKHEEVQEKNIKRQHEQIISLETKHKTTQSGGMHMAATKHREDSSSMISLQKLRDNFDSLEHTKKSGEKNLRHEIDNHKIRIKVLENELDETKDSLHRKEKEINILSSRMRELQRRRDNKTLEPVEITRKSEDFLGSGLFDQRKEFKGLVHLQGNYRKFDDTQTLTLEKNYKIKKMAFTWFQEHILSLDTVYDLPQGPAKQITSFRVAHSYQNTKSAELNFSEFQYIKEIEVYCGKWIEFMRIITSRDQILEVGSDRSYTKCKKFTFDIRTNEKPIAFLGAIETKKIFGGQGKELLISFGLEIKKKQVTGRGIKFGARHPGRTDSIRKHPSKSVFEHVNRNDKNVLEEKD